MIRKIKTLGLAIVAVLAMSAMAASAASASEFTASSYAGGATATASSPGGNDIFTTEAGPIECKQVHFHVGPLSASSNRVTVDPTYSECRSGFIHATIHMNGCDYTFFTNGNVDLTCETGEGPVTITAATCEVQIHGQDNLGKVDLISNGTDVTAQATVTNINYTVTKDGFGCLFNGTGPKTGASYTQNAAVTVTGNGGRTISIS